jgi:hypothetical protein
MHSHHRQALSASPLKQLGGYLVEAGLLTHDQVSVILNDQQATGMRFGDIVVARGWLKEQTIEWIVAKVIEPERRLLRQAVSAPQGFPTLPNSDARANLGATAPNSISQTSASKAAIGQTGQERSVTASSSTPSKFVRREAPISKPLPSVGSADGDVNWVG